MKIATLEEIGTEESRLTQIEGDSYQFLDQRKSALAEVLAIVKKNMSLNSAVLFEFGAAHYLVAPNPFTPSVRDPAISCFFAAYSREVGIPYYAFDPKYSDELLDQELENTFGRDIAGLRDGIRSANLQTYKAALAKHKQVCESGKVPVIFSHQVLNDPDLNRKYPFWTLGGLHIHYVNAIELFNEGCRLDDLEKYPDRHRVEFKQRFPIDPPIDIALPKTGEIVRYFWRK